MTPPTPPAARDAGVGELLPCPWCGVVPAIEPRVGGNDDNDRGQPCYSVVCWPCEIDGPSAVTKTDAIAAWNRRAPLPPAAPLSAADEAKIAEAITRRPPPLTLPPAPVPSPTDAERWRDFRHAAAEALDAAGIDGASRVVMNLPAPPPAPDAGGGAGFEALLTAYGDTAYLYGAHDIEGNGTSSAVWQGRGGKLRAALLAAHAAAVQAAEAVPDRREVARALRNIRGYGEWAERHTANGDTDAAERAADDCDRSFAEAMRLIYGDAPADASAEDKARAVGAAGGGR